MTITIKTQVEQAETLEIWTPCFYSHGYGFYKFNDTDCLQVKSSPWEKKLEIFPNNNSVSHLVITEGKPITEDEFNKAFCDLHDEMASIIQPQLLKTA